MKKSKKIKRTCEIGKLLKTHICKLKLGATNRSHVLQGAKVFRAVLQIIGRFESNEIATAVKIADIMPQKRPWYVVKVYLVSDMYVCMEKRLVCSYLT